jgi:hypothetical protein
MHAFFIGYLLPRAVDKQEQHFVRRIDPTECHDGARQQCSPVRPHCSFFWEIVG